MSQEITFIYCLNCPISGEPRYIGKSNDPEHRLEHGHMFEKHNNYKVNWIKSLKKKGLKPNLEILDNIPYNEWRFWERHYISLYRSWGFRLVNGTNGGDGTEEGLIPWNKGIKVPHIAWNKGLPPSQETRDKISKSLKGNIPWHTGTKGVKPPNSGSFKKGVVAYNKTNLDSMEVDKTLLKLKNKEIVQLEAMKKLKIGYSTLIKLIHGT